MKSLLKIVGTGFVAFMVLAMAQEWEFFYRSWFEPESAIEAVTDEDREAGRQAIYLTLSLMRHLYSSGGDSRFAERMPASSQIVQEMLDDIDYLARNHRRQDPELKRLEIESIASLGDNRFEVRTRELWNVRFLWILGGGESDPPRIEVIHARYLVAKTSAGWRVEGWSFAEPVGQEQAT